MCSPLLGTLEGQGPRVVSARAGQARPTHTLPSKGDPQCASCIPGTWSWELRWPAAPAPGSPVMGQGCHPRGSQAGGGAERTQGPCLSFLEAENLPSLWGDQGQVERALANCVGEASQPAGRAGLRVLGARAGRGGVGIYPAVTKPGSERAEWKLGTDQAPKHSRSPPAAPFLQAGPYGCSTHNGLWRAEAARLSQGAA